MSFYIRKKDFDQWRDATDDDWLTHIAKPIAEGVRERFYPSATTCYEEREEMINEALTDCWLCRRNLKPGSNEFGYLSTVCRSAMSRVARHEARLHRTRDRMIAKLEEGS